ncbi:transcription antitermination factor NusB [Alkalihalobacterium sp. APHAB7]|uniref:transcription antitermination factor NusB n=1 Tax=Alkalihalobacterium sp. APHAB7 TaxID=3402081 RepID=UPI003AAE1A3F
MNRRLARLRAVQALFQIDLTAVEWKEALSNSLEDGEEITPFLEKIVSGTLSHQEEIDGMLSKNLSNWSLDRVGNVDRAVLRMAVHEMKYIDDIPMNVTFNEAIELAKAFGGEESGRFVNGVLSNVVQVINKDKEEN